LEDLLGEQPGLVSAGAGADLEDDVLLVVGVLGDEEDLEVGLERVTPLLEPRDLFLAEGALVGIGAREHALGLGQVRADRLELTVDGDDALEGRALLHHLRQACAVPQRFWICEVCLEAVVSPLDFVQLVDHLPGEPLPRPAPRRHSRQTQAERTAAAPVPRGRWRKGRAWARHSSGRYSCANSLARGISTRSPRPAHW